MSFDRSVFINCPFDKSYINDLLKPVLYGLVKNKFSPRLSLEVSDSGQIRLQKITEIISIPEYVEEIRRALNKIIQVILS